MAGKLRTIELDKLYTNLKNDKGLATNSVKYVHRTLSAALEHARIYGTIPDNPARNTITKFKNTTKTPDPYTVEQVTNLLQASRGTKWEMLVVLSGLYGLRRNEALGLITQDIDLKNNVFHVRYQLDTRYQTDKTNLLTDLKETSSYRSLPITESTKPYFERHLMKRDIKLGDIENDKGLVNCKEDGEPFNHTHISREFGSLLTHLEMPSIRYHDLRHTAATNMHQLTGDYFTVSKIMGHSLKGTGEMLGISGLDQSITKQYIDVRLERMGQVLDAYHKAVFPEKEKQEKQKGNTDHLRLVVNR